MSDTHGAESVGIRILGISVVGGSCSEQMTT